MSNLMEALFPQGRPSLVAAGAEGEVVACLDEVARDPRAPELAALMNGASPAALVAAGVLASADEFWPAPESWLASYRPYVVADGVLQIPVKGVLLANLSYALGSWATGYPYIRKALERGLADANVRGIALIVDTPGGEVRGNFDLVDAIFAARPAKPIRAFALDRACSAGYSIASAASRVIVDRTGAVGSIGVVTSHVDRSEQLAKMGVKITFIHAGARKVDANSANPLPDDVRARMQARIDELMTVFVETVVRNRSLSEEAVRGTEAGVFSAKEALEQGLADEIGSLDDAVAAFAASLNTETEGESMSTISPEAHKAAVDGARAEGVAEGKGAGMKAAHERLSAILASDKVKGRETAAVALAISSPDMGAEAVAAFVGTHMTAPAPAAPAGGSRLDAIVPDPAVAHDGGTAPKAEDNSLADAVSAMLPTKR